MCQAANWRQAHDGNESLAPEVRRSSVAGVDISGRFWIFGGEDVTWNGLNDLWYFEAGHIFACSGEHVESSTQAQKIYSGNICFTGLVQGMLGLHGALSLATCCVNKIAAGSNGECFHVNVSHEATFVRPQPGHKSTLAPVPYGPHLVLLAAAVATLATDSGCLKAPFGQAGKGAGCQKGFKLRQRFE